jgi:hypothetical protein
MIPNRSGVLTEKSYLAALSSLRVCALLHQWTYRLECSPITAIRLLSDSNALELRLLGFVDPPIE